MRRFLPLLAVAALALALAATALAKPVHSELSMKINKGHTAFKGALTSTRAGCEKGLEVSLHYKAPDTTGYQVVASAHTNTDGTYKIQAIGEIQPGKYYGTTEQNGKCPATQSDKLNVKALG